MPVLLVPVAVEEAAAAAAVVDASASARPCVVEPIRRELEAAADPRVGESRAGA